MRKIEMNVYNYAELSKEAKEKVKSWYLDNIRDGLTFNDDMKENIKEKFNDIDLDFQYDLSYGQRDCFELNGKAFLYDVVEIKEIKENLTPKEMKRVEFLYNECSSCIVIEKNKCSYSDDYGYYNDDLEYCANIQSWASGKKVLMETSNKIINLFSEYVEKFSKECMEYGYSFFYEVEEEEIEEICNANGYEFYEDGENYWE